jgi:hypothetical protein
MKITGTGTVGDLGVSIVDQPLKKGLLSAAKIADTDKTIIFTKHDCIITDGDYYIFGDKGTKIFPRQGNLYPANLTDFKRRDQTKSSHLVDIASEPHPETRLIGRDPSCAGERAHSPEEHRF